MLVSDLKNVDLRLKTQRQNQNQSAVFTSCW